jgi:hypothetical protein
MGEFTYTLKDRYGELLDETLVLTDLNDSGKTFKTMADIIEKNWENL